MNMGDPILQRDGPVLKKRAPLSQSFTMETMLSFADSSSSQDEADDEEDSEEEEEPEDWVEPANNVEDCEDLKNGKHRSLSLVRTEFSSQPDLPTFIQVSIRTHLTIHATLERKTLFEALSLNFYILGLHLPWSLSWRLHS